MDPSQDNVGLAVLPPAAEYGQRLRGRSARATTTSSALAYLLVPLDNTYAFSAGQPQSAAPRYSRRSAACRRAARPRMRNALDAAQAELDRTTDARHPEVIIILSDGAANAGPNYLPNTSPYRTRPCGQAVNIATASKANQVLMYSIAYDISGAGADPCYAAQGAIVNGRTAGSSNTPEQPAIQSNEALQQIASPGNYYAQPQPTQLTTIFLAISARHRPRHQPYQRLRNQHGGGGSGGARPPPCESLTVSSPT